MILTDIVFDLQRDTGHLQILHNVPICVFCIVRIRVYCMRGREFREGDDRQFVSDAARSMVIH